MAEAEEGERPRLRLRKPETGVSFFTTFVIAMVVGFLLVVAGMPTLGAVLFTVAIISILAMVLTPSPKALAERQAAAPSEEGEEADEVSDEVDEEEDRPRTIAPPAPTSARPSAPAPPPEPPPLEEIVVDVEPEGTDEEDEAGEEDILVEL